MENKAKIEAKELVENFQNEFSYMVEYGETIYAAKRIALIAVDEKIKETNLYDRTDGYVQKRIDHLQEVKKEIIAL